jgi:exosortase/archaeosortase family protein
MFRFIILFLVYIAILFPLELVPPVDQYVIMPFTALVAKVSVGIVSLFDAHAIAVGNALESTTTGFALLIVRGCNGVEAVIIQALNLFRIISLFYLGQWNQTWFDWFHLYLWQALIVLDALVAFLIWLRYLPREPAPKAA